jgi:hypothetical protein
LSISLGVMTDGMHTFTAVATDLANNTSTSSPLTVTIDTVGQPSSIPDMTAATDGGLSNSDNVTNDNTPTFTGTAEAGAFVELLLNDTIVLQSGIATGGAWTLTSGIAIPNGSHNIKARVTDIAGNVSTSAALTPVVIDTVAPTADGGPDQIVGEGDMVTLTGSASDAGSGVGSTLWQFVSSTNGQVVPDSPGTLTFTPSSPGQYTFNYVVTDVAGNVSVDTVIVDSTFTADFDLDGDVDGDDLALWENGFGETPGAMVGDGDEDRDGSVTGSDFLAWQQQVGSALPATPAAEASVQLSAEAATMEFADAIEASALSLPPAFEGLGLQQPSGWWIDEPTTSAAGPQKAEARDEVDAVFGEWLMDVEFSGAALDDATTTVAVGVLEANDAEGEDVNAENEFELVDSVYGDELSIFG